MGPDGSPAADGSGAAAADGSGAATGSGTGGAGTNGSGATGAGGSSGKGSAASGGSSASSGTSGASSSSGGDASGGTGTTSAPPTFACDDGVAPPAESLRRLTMTEYENTVADLVAWALGGDAASIKQVSDAIAPALADLPTDVRQAVPQDLHGAYRRMDQTLQQEHVDGAYEVGTALGTALTQASVFGKVVGSCATDTSSSNDAACLDAFVKKFGARALRHPLTDDDVTFYESVYGSSTTADPQAYADVIGVMLNAPEALYFVEHGDQAVSGQTGVYTLSAYELASRLSYQLWQTAPDDELIAAADDGSLLTDATYQSEVTRMLADPRARATLDDFFEDWAKVEDLPALDAKNSDPVFQAFAGADLPDANLRQAMIDDVLGLLDYQTWTANSSVGDVFTTELSFAKDDRLASIYGVKSWDGKSTPPSLPDGQRPGLLTRALFLSTGSPNTRPIMKGVFMRKSILCDDLGDPPPGANAMPPVLGPDMTTRESVEAITEMDGTVCAGCHKPYINPLGFATEDFDALGRFRTAQVLFDDQGNKTGTKAVDTSTTPHVNFDDDTTVAGASDLMQLMRASGKLEACLARNFFRFTYARWDDPTTDGCALEPVRQAVSGDGKIQDLLAATVTTQTFRRRAFQ
ncbi:MAG TPA: DUF1592 domain-containing protein [Polyangiaceae bacterium]|nr:DUF1592 domain-containing protein [Polyangiaceae bacterium]